VTSELLNDWGIEHSHQFGSLPLDLGPLGTKAAGQVLGDPLGAEADPDLSASSSGSGHHWTDDALAGIIGE
jgi:hypothetical protein